MMAREKSTVRTRVEGSIGWITPISSPQTNIAVVRRQIIDAVAEHIRNPDVLTIIVAGFATAVLNLSEPDDPMLTRMCRRVTESFWETSKSIVVRRSHHNDEADQSEFPGDVELLTRRERQILSLACDGESARAIGARLFISERTVESHVSNGYRKLGIHSRIELIKRAAEFCL